MGWFGLGDKHASWDDDSEIDEETVKWSMWSRENEGRKAKKEKSAPPKNTPKGKKGWSLW